MTTPPTHPYDDPDRAATTPTPADPAGDPAGPSRPVGRKRAALAGAVSLAVLVVGGGTGFALGRATEDSAGAQQGGPGGGPPGMTRNGAPGGTQNGTPPNAPQGTQQGAAG